MAENEQPKPKKLGQSTNVKIGGKQYASYDISNYKQQTKEVHTVTGMENAPRDISNKTVDNQQNTIKTENVKSLTDHNKPVSAITKKEVGSTNRNTVNSNSSLAKVGSNIIATAANKAQNALGAQEDSGSKTLSTALSAGRVTVKVFKTAQNMSPHIAKGTIKLNRNTAARLKKMEMYKLKSTRPPQTLTHAVTGVKPAVGTAKHYRFKVGHGSQRTAVLVKGKTLGTVKIKVNKESINTIKNTTIRGTIKGAKAGRKVLGYKVKTGIASGIKTSVNIGKGINRGFLSAGNMLTNTGDMGAQALGYGLKTTHYVVKGMSYTPRLAKATYKGVKTGINTMVKTGKFVNKSYKGVKTGIKAAKKAGGKKALKTYAKRWRKSVRGKAVKAFKKAGNSIVSVVIEGIKKLGAKVIIPLILIVLVIACGANVISSFAAAVSSILSPFISDKSGGEVDETAWLISKITVMRNNLIQDIKDTYKDNLVENGGEYHFVRFFNVFNDSEIELSNTNINTSIYSVEEYEQYIQPIFHTLIMSEYELEASEVEMQGILDDVWSKMSTIVTEELPVEYCQMTKTDNADGTYSITPVKENDDNVHADITICPNYSTIQHHSDNTSEPLCSCDYWYWTCNGHINDEGEWTEHSGQLSSSCSDSEQHKGCNGYYICNGHKILSLSVELRGFGDLLNDYYLNEINDLESKSGLNSNQRRRLQTLKENYEICLNYALVLEEEYGTDDGAVVDLDGVILTDLTDFACQFIGKPYVWGGTDPNTGADCSGFVQYVYARFGVSLPRALQDQVSCGSTVSSISDAQAGDLIFWSHNGSDSEVYHVAIYLGDGKMIHASNSKPYPQGGIKVSNVYGSVYKIKRIAR